MEEMNQQLLGQLRFISRASNYFMYQHQQGFNGQKRVLAVLKLEDGLTQNYLAKILALSPGSLAELLKKLEDKGEIRREVAKNDRRSKKIYLTEVGRKLADQQAAAMKENSGADFFAGLTADEQERLSELLVKIPSGWDEEFKTKTDKFVEPFDRMELMRKYRGKWRHHDFSEEEIKEWRKKYGRHHFHGNCHYGDSWCGK
ncbi:MarR family transcriptional regulator [Lactobacillus sp. ESL0791]|uniref:MarR family winged helix-turn-helix transcriptional regulator n=1 Tax=Lactobacillus sp. ESL0791 TaxID=2983234 RepID=UPI0023F81200|nr:MarR family transcriptional regulator [Lactobacillus sp. ESL0791]MDF7639687.1 MarR family transcriptional regulator [Lactobacillus sp. ESL0791]